MKGSRCNLYCRRRVVDKFHTNSRIIIQTFHLDRLRLISHTMTRRSKLVVLQILTYLPLQDYDPSHNI